MVSLFASRIFYGGRGRWFVSSLSGIKIFFPHRNRAADPQVFVRCFRVRRNQANNINSRSASCAIVSRRISTFFRRNITGKFLISILVVNQRIPFFHHPSFFFFFFSRFEKTRVTRFYFLLFLQGTILVEILYASRVLCKIRSKN